MLTYAWQILAQGDRLLVRRMAAMAGSVQVDLGSDDEDQVYGDLYESESRAHAEVQARHFDPYLR